MDIARVYTALSCENMQRILWWAWRRRQTELMLRPAECLNMQAHTHIQTILYTHTLHIYMYIYTDSCYNVCTPKQQCATRLQAVHSAGAILRE